MHCDFLSTTYCGALAIMASLALCEPVTLSQLPFHVKLNPQPCVRVCPATTCRGPLAAMPSVHPPTSLGNPE